MIKVYIQTDSQNNVIAINSEPFIKDLNNWILIDEGVGDRYSHAQSQYLPSSLKDLSNDSYNFKYENGELKPRQ